ncbi:MAG: nucleotidyltransferase family protein [Alphaproteobacteria bacterium]|nr:nucleotidyltransferase family protein [Alphaproteobacteria bacterium]
MVLAAGLGLRMRPVTLETPKPLVAVAGRTMLDRALDHLAAAGVAEAVVNVHWLAAKIEAHLAARARPRIVISREDTLLETGGGIARALPLLGPAPFYSANADIVWTDGAAPALDRLAASWDARRMDALLLLNPVDRAYGYDGDGDFHAAPDGRLRRRGDGPAPLVFTGVQILTPALFDGAPPGAFSLNRLYDRAAEAGRLHGLVHDGDWFHVGTVDGLATAEAVLGRAR